MTLLFYNNVGRFSEVFYASMLTTRLIFSGEVTDDSFQVGGMNSHFI